MRGHRHSSPPVESRRNVAGIRVNQLRRGRGWSHAALARRLRQIGWEIQATEVERIESGEVTLWDFELCFLASVFGVEVRDLLPHGAGASVPEEVNRWLDSNAGVAEVVPTSSRAQSEHCQKKSEYAGERLSSSENAEERIGS